MENYPYPLKFKYGEELENELDSIQGILDRLDTFGDATVSDERDKIVIANTLKKLPKDVRDKVLSEVLFIMMRAVRNKLDNLYFPTG